MPSPLKQHFIDELKSHYRSLIQGAHRAERSAAETAETLRAEARSKEDAKGAVEFGRSEGTHRQRRERAKRELEALVRFTAGGVRDYGPSSRVGAGALVDLRADDASGDEERTFFLLPVGAGAELKGPGGDGHISVITHDSPLGRALHGACVGDEVEVEVQGRTREWTVVDLS